MRPILVGLIGFAGSGKSTVARMLEADGFKRRKFAGPLKDMLRAIGLTERHIEGDLKEEPCDLLCGQTPRHAMVTLGTEWGRHLIGDQFWVNLLAISARDDMQSGLNVVVDDVRFPNEVETIKRLGGTIIKVLRPTPTVVVSHESESHIASLQHDYVLLNDGTLSDLLRAVKMMTSMGGEL